MKKILSLILSFAVAISSMGMPCFAQDDNLAINETNINYKQELLSQDVLNSCFEKCKSEIMKNKSNNNQDKSIEGSFFLFVWNLSELVVINILKMVAGLTFVSVSVCYNVVRVVVKGTLDMLFGTGKILGRFPSSFYDMLTGYKSKQIKELQEELEKIKIENEKCTG